MRATKAIAVSLVVIAGALGTEWLPTRSASPVAAMEPALLQVQSATAQSAQTGSAAAPAVPTRSGETGGATRPSADVARLRLDLNEIVGRSNTGAQLGIMVVSLERGDTLYALNPDVPLAPASNMKLYSTAAALYYLGPEFRFSTYVLGSGDVQDGVLHGDLILFGTGDPSMSGRMLAGPLTPLRALADTLRARGIREVRGDVVGDGSYFDSEWLGRGWSPDNLGAWYSAPVGALSVAENVVSIRIQPGAVGGPTQLTTTPGTMGLEVINRTTTVASGRTLIRFQYEPEGLVLSGQMARNHPGLARSAAVADPTNYATAVFRRLLEEQGISVEGGVRMVHATEDSPVTFANRSNRNGEPQPHPRVLAVHLSPPLLDLIAVTNRVSHNLFAEALMKAVGRVALGEGTFDAGSRAVRYFLECEASVDTATLAIVDGSGLSTLNRVTARSTIQLLDMMRRSEHWEAYFNSLPEAGAPRPRGLQRMHGSRAVGNLRAKTGTIRTVSSLSGYVRSADGEQMAFSIIANNLPSSAWLAKRIEDQIGMRVAEFRRPPEQRSPPEVPDTATLDEADTATAPTPAPQTAPAAQAAQQHERPAPAEQRTYRIRSGDTLDGIARRHGTTVAALQRANPGIDPRRLRPGQTIRLP